MVTLNILIGALDLGFVKKEIGNLIRGGFSAEFRFLYPFVIVTEL
jgi:hypothetical protein